MSIAKNRHHIQRLKHNRRYHWGRDLFNEPQGLGKAVTTPCSCSCYMCGNPRKHYQEKTLQELRHEEDYYEQLAIVYYNIP